ncbi:glycosyltransferase family 2 protein [Plantibacter sp. Mn2098]|uniref:glycosyltransferase family 2 protein n=1 Tax=Plantibacter sp. Mn2098 TaxID=3395266 RepID=UPI003BD10B05
MNLDHSDGRQAASGELSLVVGILTFRRPEDLAASLPKVLEQTTRLLDARLGVTRTEVLVVDNDPAASAADVVGGFATVRYVVESTPGIAAARNRALDEAQPAELLVFIDDDEEPGDDWLIPLVETWLATTPAAVMGRVQSHLPDGTDPWVVAGGFFTRRQLPTGTEIDEAAAGNLLLDLGQVQRLGVRFATELGLGGGEDTLFSKQVTHRGGRIVWCNESVTHDFVDRDRATRRWAMQRAWSHGNTRITIERAFAATTAERARVRLAAAFGGLARAVLGAMRAVFGIVTGSLHHRVRGARAVSRGGGMFVGAFGVVFQEYVRPEAEPARTTHQGDGGLG